MNSKYLYLTVNIISFIIPFAFSFYPKANFSKKWKYVLPAILITSILFIVWDVIFTRMGIWGFNPKYVSGLNVFNLPIEEVLFFFCIPYACVFTYFALSSLVNLDYGYPHHKTISGILILILLTFGVYCSNLMYTSVTFIVTGLFLAFQMWKLRPRYMRRFYFTFLFLLVPFFLVNSALTGLFTNEPVVFYNNDENLGIRLGTIPIEDVIYGMLMVFMNISISEELEARLKHKSWINNRLIISIISSVRRLLKKSDYI